MNDEMVVRQEAAGDLDAMFAPDVKRTIQHMNALNEILEAVLKEGVHYMQIPGVKEKSLKKAGADVLAVTFRLSMDIVKEDVKELTGDHREYSFVMQARHIASGNIIASGVGTCSTMEKKYRYRQEHGSGKEVGDIPQGFWEAWKGRKSGGKMPAEFKGCYPEKVNGKWRLFKNDDMGERIENPEIADCYNTVRKMAYKRAYVACAINSTACSHIFTQDLDDMETIRELA